MGSLAVFLLLNGLAFGGAGLVARFGLRMQGRLALALGTLLVGWVGIVLGLELLGTLGGIRLGPACLWAAGMLLAGGVCWLLAVREHAGRCGSEPAQAPSPGLSDIERPGRFGRIGNQLNHIFVGLAAVLAAWAALDTLIGSVMAPVQPISDAPIYHLYFAIRWWQSGFLELIPTPFGESAAPYFPANGDVWFTWLILSWSSELMAKVGQWPFLGVGMLAVWGLARELPVSPRAALVPAVLWGTGSLPVIHSGLADVDLIMAAWYLVGIWFLVRYQSNRRLGDLVAVGLALGAVLGTKFIATVLVPWPAAVAAAGAFRGTRRWLHLGVLALCLALPAGYWYLRNIVLTGNPLYPLHLQVLGVPLLRGWYERVTLHTSQYHIPASDWKSLVLILLRGLDLVLVPVWLAGVGLSIGAAVKRHGLALLLCLLGILHIVLFWIVNPYQTQDRFLFTAFGLLAVPTGLVVEKWPVLYGPFTALIGWHLFLGPNPVVDLIRRRVGIDLADPRLPPLMPGPFGSISSWAVLTTNPIWRDRCVLLVSLLVAAGLLRLHGRKLFDRLIWFMAAVVLTFGIGHRSYHCWIPDSEFRFYPVSEQVGYTIGWFALEQASGAGCRVAYAGTNLPYYLCGRGLRNQVRYVNVNGHGGFRMHDYHLYYSSPMASSATPAWDRQELKEIEWLRNLRDQQIDLLFVGFVNRAGGEHNFFDRDGFPVERTWAERNPKVFSVLHADSRTRLYRVHFAGD